MESPWIEMLLLINDNTNEYIIIVIAVSFFYWILFRKFIYDICDPLFFSIFASAMATSVVIFMFLYDLIVKNEYFESFILTEFFYLFGILCIPKIKKFNKFVLLPVKNINVLFYIYTSLYIFVQISIYITMGIPIFSNSEHSNFYAGGNGGLFFILQATSLPTYFLVFYKNFFCNDQKNLVIDVFCKFSLAFIICSLFLSGAKGALLQCLIILFFLKVYGLHFKMEEKLNYLNRLKKKFIFLAIIGAFGVLFLKVQDGDFDFILEILINRFIGFGDIFAYFYGANIENYLSIGNAFFGMFGSLLAKLRLIDYEDIPIAFGGQVLQATYNVSNIQGGPNFRHNIFSYIYFGVYGGALFSFLLGIFVGFVRNILYAFTLNNIYFFLLYIIVYTGACSLSTDIPLNTNTLISTIIFNVLFMFCICQARYFWNYKIHK